MNTPQETLDADQKLLDWVGRTNGAEPYVAPQRPLERFHRISETRWFRIAFVAFTIVAVTSSAIRILDPLTPEAREVMKGWLESQRRGEDGLVFWGDADWVSPSNLFSVRSWEIVNADTRGKNDAYYTVIIDSSTRGGIPITKTWKIWLHKEDDQDQLKIMTLDDVSD